MIPPARGALATALVAALQLAPAGAWAEPFVDVAGPLGLPATPAPLIGSQLVAAVSLADLDGDGRIDLVRSGGSRPPQLYRRAPDGTFALVPGAFPGLELDVDATGHLLFDMDGDGDRDVLFARDGRERLFENLGDATFVEVTDDRLPSTAGWSASVAAGDLDGDGDLDLVVARYVDRVDFPLHRCADNLIYENVGGRFVDRGADSGFDRVRGCSFMTALVDIDDDLDLDIVVINDFAAFSGPQELWMNDGDFRFRERARELGFVAPVFGMGVALGDPDEDGRWDAVVTNIGEPLALEREDDGRFVDAIGARGIGVRFGPVQNQVTWAARWEDVDGDGWLDLLMAGGYLSAAPFIASSDAQASVLLRGGPDGKLAPVAAADAFVDARHSARDVHIEDIDGDARPEIVMVHIDGRIGVYRGATPTTPTTTLELVPTTTGYGAAGAMVNATACGVIRRRGVVGGASYGSADRGLVRLTFPDCGPGHKVAGEVRWPSGYRQAFTTTTGGTTRLEEPAWLAIADGRARVDLTDHVGVVDDVELGGSGLVVGSITVVGRVWTADVALATPGSEGALDVVVDGRTWGAHPRIGRAVPLFHDPTWPIVGETFRVGTSPRARVRWLGVDAVADDAGRVTLVAPEAPGAHALEVAADDGVMTRNLTIAPPVDRARSDLTVRDAHVRLDQVDSKMVRLRMRLLDANGRVAAIPPDEVGVLVDGVERAPTALDYDGQQWTLRVSHWSLHDGAMVQPTIGGEPWFDPIRVAHVANDDELGRLVDVARSHCWLVEPRLWAGVGDRGTVVAAFVDAYGVRIPDGAQALQWTGVGALVLPMRPVNLGVLGASAEVRAGVGEGTVSVVMGGQVAPLACPITVGPRPEPEAVATATLALVGNGIPIAGAPTTWLVVPQGASRRAVGPGVTLAMEIEDGEVTIAPSYVGGGRYEVTLVMRGVPTTEVRVRVDDRVVASVTADVAPGDPIGDPGPESGPEPGPEASTENDQDEDTIGSGGDAEAAAAEIEGEDDATGAHDATDGHADGADDGPVGGDSATTGSPEGEGTGAVEAARGGTDGCSGGPASLFGLAVALAFSWARRPGRVAGRPRSTYNMGA